MKQKHILIILVILVFLILVVFQIHNKFKLIEIGGKKFIAKTSLTQEEHARGLGGEKSLCRRCAMLFVFNDNGQKSFWMKEMNFDLDIIWIAGGKIAYIAKNVSHNSPDIITPNLGADKVLEISAGLSDRFGFKAGDPIRIY
jgi:hypothetical protein